MTADAQCPHCNAFFPAGSSHYCTALGCAVAHVPMTDLESELRALFFEAINDGELDESDVSVYVSAALRAIRKTYADHPSTPRRDMFAAAALQGLLAGNPDYELDGAAMDAWAHADAMFEAERGEE